MGIEEAIGFNSAEDGITAVNPEEEDQVRSYSLRGMTPFFRESLPLILFSLLGWGYVLEQWIRRQGARWWGRISARSGRLFLDHTIPKLFWFLPASVFWWAWSFFIEYEGSVFHELGGMAWLWYVMAIVGLVAALWPRPSLAPAMQQPDMSHLPLSTQPPIAKKQAPINTVFGMKDRDEAEKEESDRKSDEPTSVSAATILVAPLWLLGLVIFYISWIKFHANYIVEFLLPLAIMSGIGLYLLWDQILMKTETKERRLSLSILSKILVGATTLVILWAVYLSNYVTYVYEHTGTFHQGSLQQAAQWAHENISAEQTIFTGAGAVPYLSGHRTALDIAHPRWYAYEFTRKDTERLNTFLPPAEVMVQAFRDTQWVLYERQTGFSFLMEYSEIERSLFETGEFELVHEVENGSNALQFYRRVRPSAT